MDNVVDLRPDRFLREVREDCDISRASERAGIAVPELEKLLKNRKFFISVAECIRERREERLLESYQSELAMLDSKYKYLMAELDDQTASIIREHASTG